MRRLLVTLTAIAAVNVAELLSGGPAIGGAIIPEPVARQHGLTRPWFTRVLMDSSRARIRNIVLQQGTLFVQTDTAMLHAIDAETGQTLWYARVGKPGYPSLGPAANKRLVAVVNGTTIYVLDRQNGKLLWERKCETLPGAGPALSEQRVYIPMVNGQVHSYRLQALLTPAERLALLEKEKAETEQAEQSETQAQTPPAKSQQPSGETVPFRLEKRALRPLVCQSYGRVMIEPLVTRQTPGEEYVAWGTDRGYLFVGFIQRFRQDRFPMLYRLETQGRISVKPSYRPPDPTVPGASGLIYITSQDGHVYAVREKDGSLLWRFSAGQPMAQPAVVIDDRIYAATELGGMYCLDAQKGTRIWWTPSIMQFVAASRQRLYTVDDLERLCILDVTSGAQLDAINVQQLPIRLLNDQTDRIYLATEDGLIQCLREIELAEPIEHNKVAEPQPPGKEQGQSAEQPAGQQPGAAENPFAPVEQPQAPAGGENPFQAAPNPFQ